MADPNLLSALSGLAQGFAQAFQARQARKQMMEDYQREQETARDRYLTQALYETAGAGVPSAGQRLDVKLGTALDRNDPRFGELLRNRPNLTQALSPRSNIGMRVPMEGQQGGIGMRLQPLQQSDLTDGPVREDVSYTPTGRAILGSLQQGTAAGLNAHEAEMRRLANQYEAVSPGLRSLVEGGIAENRRRAGEVGGLRLPDIAPISPYAPIKRYQEAQDIAPVPPKPIVTSDNLAGFQSEAEKFVGSPMEARSSSATRGPFEDLALLRREKEARDKDLAREKMQEEIQRIKSQTQANESRVMVQKSLDKLNRARAALLAAQRTGRGKDDRLNALNKTHEAIFDAQSRIDDFLNIEGLTPEEEARYTAQADQLQGYDEEVLNEMRAFSGLGDENNAPKSTDSRAVDFYRTLVNRLSKDFRKSSKIIGMEPGEMEDIKQRARDMTLTRYPDIDEGLLTLPNEVQHQEPIIPGPQTTMPARPAPQSVDNMRAKIIAYLQKRGYDPIDENIKAIMDKPEVLAKILNAQ